MRLNDVEKREAIKKYLGFDVTRAIEIKQEDERIEEEAAASRRLAPEPAASKVAETAPTERRVKIIGQKES